jgi:hypothetical protein
MFQTTDLLYHFNPQVLEKDNIYEIVYINGEYKGNVIYEKKVIRGVNKPIVQNVYIIKSSDMGDVIEYINKKSPLTDEDLLSINKIIRDDSLQRLMEYIKEV